MRDRVARIVLAVLSGLLVLAAVLVDLPLASEGRFWSDGATYYSMAASLAFDGDVEFRPEDLRRVRSSYPGGPQGVFLKAVPDGRGGERLVYAKPLVYPMLAAPLVWAAGVDRGMPLVNALLLVAALWAGYFMLREDTRAVAAAAGSMSVLLAGVTPVYLLWQTPELCYLGLVTLGLFAWRRSRPFVAAILIGVAAYAKPTNAALALPLLLAPLLGGEPPSVAARPWRRAAGESAMRAVVLILVVAGGFGLNRWMTGEFNYQGGVRKTFYDVYPHDPGVGFGSAGVWTITDHVGPLVAGRDDESQTARIAPARTPGELRQSFVLNLLYFWIGRFGGALPYFPGVGAALVLFLTSGPRRREGWLAVLALVVSWVGYVLIIPDNWYGGAGTIGNRYFVNLAPLGLLLLPRRRGMLAAVLAWPVAALLLGPLFVAPVRHSLAPGAHATRSAFRVLPAELTMLSDLSVFTDVWRKHRPYNAPGGDPARRPSGAPPAYFLWFLDDGTFGQESSFGEEGFWVRGGERAEVVLQTLVPPPRIRLVVTAGPQGDIVTVWLGGQRERRVLRPLRTSEIVLARTRSAVGYYGTQLYRLRIGSRFGGPSEQDDRKLGSFVRVVLDEARPER